MAIPDPEVCPAPVDFPAQWVADLVAHPDPADFPALAAHRLPVADSVFRAEALALPAVARR